MDFHETTRSNEVSKFGRVIQEICFKAKKTLKRDPLIPLVPFRAYYVPVEKVLTIPRPRLRRK